MSDYGFDGMVKVSWVPTIANIAAPTTAELNAGTSLEDVLTADGLMIGAETAGINNSKLSSVENTEIVGRSTYSLGVKYVRGSHAAATAAETALTRGAAGYLVVRRDIAATTAWTAAQKAEVYSAACGAKQPDTPAPDALQAVTVPMKNTGPNRTLDNRATIA